MVKNAKKNEKRSNGFEPLSPTEVGMLTIAPFSRVNSLLVLLIMQMVNSAMYDLECMSNVGPVYDRPTFTQFHPSVTTRNKAYLRTCQPLLLPRLKQYLAYFTPILTFYV